jgi:hypothetical protein
VPGRAGPQNPQNAIQNTPVRRVWSPRSGLLGWQVRLQPPQLRFRQITPSHPASRNKTLRAIRHLGRRLWKRWSGYHRRSLVETAMSRLKHPGERLLARDPDRQVAEVQVRCAFLNTFNCLGMPDTVALT